LLYSLTSKNRAILGGTNNKVLTLSINTNLPKFNNNDVLAIAYEEEQTYTREQAIEWLLNNGERVAVPGSTSKYPSAYAMDGTVTPAVNGSPLRGNTGTTIGGFITPPDLWYKVRGISGGGTRRMDVYHSIQESKIYTSGKAGAGLRFLSSATDPFINSYPRYIPPNIPLSHLFYGVTDNSTDNWIYASGTDYEAVTADLDLHANKVMLVTGDSIERGTMASTYDMYDIYHFKLKRWLWNTQDTIRVCNKSYPGQNSSVATYSIQSGEYNLRQVNLWIWKYGTNNVTASGYAQANIDAFELDLLNSIAFKQERFPDCHMMIVGPPPMANATHEARLEVLRQKEQTIVAAANDPRITYVETKDLYDPTANGTTFNNDGIHPVNNGHNLMFGRFQTHITTNNIRI
jgi:hypothetical protein